MVGVREDCSKSSTYIHGSTALLICCCLFDRFELQERLLQVRLRAVIVTASMNKNEAK
jgi:hypothetical protein